MSKERLFLDTAFIQALINRRDQYHEKAKTMFPRVRRARSVLLTEAILIEVGNALSRFDRTAAVEFLDSCLGEREAATANLTIVPVDTALLSRGVDLYRSTPDKEWGLTDCISFVVMRENGLIDAVTTDRHFTQAGFRAMMLEEG
ncbi:MAG: type II toxin-antitoxin system VapC family toxin [Isosphaeraceae bacterium]